MRAGDAVSLAAGLWFVPKFVSGKEIGAVLPVSSFATFISLPVFALAMAVMKESAVLAARGERGKVRSLLAGVFAAAALALVATLAAAALAMPRFLERMRVPDASVGFLVVAAAFLGCFAPVYTDALQSLKRFRALAAVECAGACVRFLTMLAVMPFRALAGYFAGQAALPAFRIVGSVAALWRDLRGRGEPYWNLGSARRLAISFAAVLAYQAAPMYASFVEQTVLRGALPDADSGGYFMATRFSDALFYFSFPLLLVMFPYTAAAAERRDSTAPYVLRCCAAALAVAAAMATAYAFFGETFMSWLPNGTEYLAYARYMPSLTIVAALTTCQVFCTNAEVSAGRFGFLWWLIPLHVAYAPALSFAADAGIVSSLDDAIRWFAAASVLRFLFSAATVCRAARR